MTRNVYVVETYAIGLAGMAGIQYYEIHVAPEPDPEAPRVAFMTADPRVYALAAEAEDYDRRFDVTWHRIETKFGAKYQIDRFDEK